MDGEMRAIVENLQAQQNRLESQIGSFNSVAKELSTTMQKLTIAVERLAARQDKTEEDVKEIKTTVKEMNEKPGKKWETITTYAATAVVGGLITLLIAQFFTK